jgi:hypothetical protein
MQQTAQPGDLSAQAKQKLLQAHEAVWRAFFTNDQATLAKLVPADTSVLEDSPEKPFVRQSEIPALRRSCAAMAKRRSNVRAKN